jgi:ABC-type protease/lipase transport system fused ATPase/permease subunit
MLQIYDRVLSSRSVPTLVALSIFLVGAYAFRARSISSARAWWCERRRCSIGVWRSPCMAR